MDARFFGRRKLLYPELTFTTSFFLPTPSTTSLSSTCILVSVLLFAIIRTEAGRQEAARSASCGMPLGDARKALALVAASAIPIPILKASFILRPL
eukprot:21124_4